MIKTVVVDDERLVRKGFISLFDWSSYGMVVVGEAGDGKSALELLQQTEVDLLFTDITMPGMSGFDLIKEARRRHPHVRSVVLTCHHEFDFVQEALRLGAIDYIVKTLLELDNADPTMRRIVERIEWEDGSRASLAVGTARKLPADSALVFRPFASDCGSAELYELPIVRRNPVVELNGMWLMPLVHSCPMADMKRDLKVRLAGRWEFAIVTGTSDLTAEEAGRLLAELMPREWFYAASGDELLQVELGAGKPTRHGSGKQIGEMLQDAMDLKWTLSGEALEDFKRSINSLEPEPEQLTGLAEALCREWRGMLLPVEAAERLQETISQNRTWADWQNWLWRYSDVVKRRMVELSFTAEVMLCLIRAVRYMKEHTGQKINQADVAARVNMSRGYFSACFARFAGESFGSVLRDIRFDRAKSLLRDTKDPIYQVALSSGFEDEKYFSKLFRKQVGMLPSEYRETERRERT